MKEVKRVPKLRFPDFLEEWKEKKYRNIYSFYSTNSFSRDNLNYESGAIKNIHYGDIHTKFSTLFDIEKEIVPFVNDDIKISNIKDENYLNEGDLLIADASEDYNDIGKTIEVVNLNNEKVISGLHTFHARPNKFKMALGFSGFMLQNKNVRLQVKKIAQGTKVLGLATSRLGEINLNIPSFSEQQKIATFLASVDKKIDQLQQKKHLLEQYKKGVMQQVFSQQLRFKDDNGNDYPDWEEKKLGELVLFQNGKAHEQDISHDGEYIVVNSKFISTDGQVKKFSNELICPLAKNDIVMVMSDVPNGKAIAKCYFIDRDNAYTLNQRICSLRTKGTNPTYLFYILNRNRYYLKFDSGVSQTNLRKDEVLDCPLNIPESLNEQAKIANFLSGIDKKIALVTTQIENTQQFKKGLLQQLFV